MRLTVVIILSPWERPKAGQRAVAAATLALIQPTEEARLWVSIAPPRPMAPPRLPTTTQRSLRHGIAGPQPLRSFKRCPTIREAPARRPSDMRTEERRVGTAWVRTCRSRGAPVH